MRNVFCSIVLFVVATVLLAVGCQKSAETPETKQYEVHAKVVAVNKDGNTVTLDHEEIPGLMKAMKMDYKVDNQQVLEGVQAGEEVHGRLEVRSGEYIITDLQEH